jgi:hypothetical protein
MSYRTRLAAAFISVAAGSACHDDGLDNHGCPIEYDGRWTIYAIAGEHTEPRQCPVFMDRPRDLETGATFVDQGGRDVNRAFMLVVDAREDPVSGGKIADFGVDALGRWSVPMYQQYRAGTAGPLLPDYADFDLYWHDDIRASARLTINYTDAFSASISGPTTIHESETHTWSASVRTGVPPYTFRWYVDWELVSTDPTVTLSGRAEDMLLRLDMTDGRGHAVSASTPIYVTHCADPKAELC